jgi:hypothetical protein
MTPISPGNHTQPSEKCLSVPYRQLNVIRKVNQKTDTKVWLFSK